MNSLHSIQRRLSVLALALCAVVALSLPTAASAMPIIDTGPVVEPQSTVAPSGDNDALLLAGAALAVVVLTGVAFRFVHIRPAHVKA